MLLLFGVSLLLVTGVFVSIILSSQERIAELETRISSYVDNTRSAMHYWDDDDIITARADYLAKGWIPPGHQLYEVALHGQYRFVAGIVATSEAEAVEKLKKGYIVYGVTAEAMNSIPSELGGWCDEGYNAFLRGLAALHVGTPVFDYDFESVGVMRVFPTAEPERVYAFKLIWDDVRFGGRRFEYTATIKAACLNAALDVLLLGQDVLRSSDTDTPLNAAWDNRAGVALSMLTTERASWSYGHLKNDEHNTFVSYEVVSDPVTEPVAA